jgi:xylan 1,4-beta-xylosidase
MSECNIHPFFHAHHAPVGAFATLTLGAKGASGGLGLELARAAGEAVYMGLESADEPGRYQALPFFGEETGEDHSQDFDVESHAGIVRPHALEPIPDEQIERSLGPCVDEWRAGDLTCRILSPAHPVPDPDGADDDAMRMALQPAVLVELRVDNRRCARERKTFFGFAGSDRTHAMRCWTAPGLTCIGQGAVAIGCASADVWPGIGFQPEAVLEPSRLSNLPFLLGQAGLIVGAVPAGEERTFRFAVSFFREGNATEGLRSRYLYRRYFASPEEVLRFALDRFAESAARAEAFDRRLEGLSPDRQFVLSQAIRSYYGSTQALEREDGTPIWIVNEGEYRMMNTLDLTVDQAFFELDQNPWTVRSELNLHRERGLYRDAHGVAFTHDLGVANVFAESGRSAYEQAGLTGCFSYMSCEELANWCLTACLYAHRAGDRKWLEESSPLLGECFESLQRRDHADPSMRDGVMSLDSDRCEGGSEITTYDSLDASLGRARGNLYLAVKTWAAYVLLADAFEELGRAPQADQARSQAARAASTIASAADASGVLPALLDDECAAFVLPAIEGLAFPLYLGMADVLSKNGPYGELIETLERHFRAVLSPGRCRFANGGWRLSSTSRNSWLSKIALCQFVAEKLFGMEPDEPADRIHRSWLTSTENAENSFTDQILEGKPIGSRYYPRGVTAWLWLQETPDVGAERAEESALAEAIR